MLRPLQELFNPARYPDLLVGIGSPDDAAVYRLDDERALIITTDFFTPIVDDAYQYGAIAAVNALSDVYAMGGKPLVALNIAALPPDLPLEVSKAMLMGMAEKVYEAGAVIAGGHTIQDKEPKIGLAVIGLAPPDKLLTKNGVRPGDALILTKPIGTGCITTAAKNDKAAPADVDEVITWMMQLNRVGAELAVELGARAATDVTGFGLMGHASELAELSGVTLRMEAAHIPLMSSAMKYAAMWTFPGGSSANRLAYEPMVRFEGAISEELRMLLFDAQTSGGLLIALPPEKLDAFGAKMHARGERWWHIGEALPREDVNIVVVG